MSDFADELLAFRESRGLSRWALAKLLGMDPRNGSTTIARIERRQVKAQHESIWRLALAQLAREMEGRG